MQTEDDEKLMRFGNRLVLEVLPMKLLTAEVFDRGLEIIFYPAEAGGVFRIRFVVQGGKGEGVFSFV